MKFKKIKSLAKQEFYKKFQFFNNGFSFETLFTYGDGRDFRSMLREELLDYGGKIIDNWDIRNVKTLLSLFPGITKKAFTSLEYSDKGWELNFK